MKTIANGLILKGIDLSPVKENIVIDDENKKSPRMLKKEKSLMHQIRLYAQGSSMHIHILGIPSLRMKEMA